MTTRPSLPAVTRGRAVWGLHARTAVSIACGRSVVQRLFPVPLIFSPITMVNRAGECGWQQPVWMQAAFESNERTSRLYNLASNMAALEDREERPCLHLFDGGLVDNLGLRTLLAGAGAAVVSSP